MFNRPPLTALVKSLRDEVETLLNSVAKPSPAADSKNS